MIYSYSIVPHVPHVTHVTCFGVQSRNVKSAEIVKVEKMIMSENDNVKNDILECRVEVLNQLKLSKLKMVRRIPIDLSVYIHPYVMGNSD